MSLDFDGTDDYFTTPAATPFNITGNQTYCVWLILDTSAGAGRGIMSRASWPILFYAADVSGNFVTFWSDSWGDKFTTGALTLGAYTHYAGVRSGTSILHYFNGVLDSTVTGATPNPATGGGYIIGDNFGLWDGILEDFRTYNRALNAAEIATIYASRGHDMIVNGLVYRTKMNELAHGTAMTATSALDYSTTRANSDAINSTPTYQASRLAYRRRIA